jgi:mannose-6-phosphate isomerase-like protein (cupin superfamily)
VAAYTLKEIDAMGSLHHGAVKLAADELAVESFGMQVLDFPAGFDQYPEHDHADERMEEVYVVLRGSARFTIDGEEVPLDETQMLRIAPDAKRSLEPGPGGVRILAIGRPVAGAYERPEAFRVVARA